MKHLLRSIAALLFLSLATWAQEVYDDTTWTNGDGSISVTVDITQHSLGNDAGVTFTDAAGTSPSVTGTLGDNSTASNPTVTDSEEGQTPSPGSSTYRVKDGKVERKNADGTWSKLRKKKKTGSSQTTMERISAGDLAPHDGVLVSPDHPELPLQTNDVAPWDGWLSSPGEEITSLPGPQ